jgi:hypothetical protein
MIGIPFEGGSDNVVAYNFFTNMVYNDPTIRRQGVGFHASYPQMNLFEGNYGLCFFGDTYFGNNGVQTFLRNRVFLNRNWTVSPFNFDFVGQVWYLSFIGNIIGQTGWETAYQMNTNNSYGYGSSPKTIWRAGYNDIWQSSPSTFAYPEVLTKMIRHGNWDSVTTTNNGIVWSTNTDHNIPASYYLSGRPGYWGANQPWPPFDPASPAAATATNIPAGYRYTFGVDPPGGAVTNAPTISNISVGPFATNSASVTWNTDVPATSIVDYGSTVAYGTSVTNISLVLSHSMTIAGLSPGSTNHFRVRSANASGALAASSDGTIAVPAPPAPPTGLRVILP